MSDVPRSSLSRSAKLASIPLGLAGRSAVGWGRKVAGGDAAQIDAEQQRAFAEQVFEVLGQLKGGAMKVGQSLSVLEAAFPDSTPLRCARRWCGCRRARRRCGPKRSTASSARSLTAVAHLEVPLLRRPAGRGRVHRAGAPGGVA